MCEVITEFYLFFLYVRFIPCLRKCQLSTSNIQNPEKRTVLTCTRPQPYTDRTWYEPRGQSDSVGRVWPGQPQGVVLVKLAQVNLTDDHSAVSSVAVTDKQAHIYCGSAAVLCRNSFTSWHAVVGTEDIWGFMWICCFTHCSHKIKLRHVLVFLRKLTQRSLLWSQGAITGHYTQIISDLLTVLSWYLS